MTVILYLTEAKARFSEVVERASQGEEVIVTRMGRPAVKVVAHEPARAARRLGVFAGQIEVAPDFDQWPQDVARALGVDARC